MDRREILQTLGVTTLLPTTALGRMSGIPTSCGNVPRPPESKPQHSIRFAVCGMSHDHIYGMVGAIQRGGGELVAAFGEEPDKLAAFTKRYPDVKRVKSEDEILNDCVDPVGVELDDCQSPRSSGRPGDGARQGFSR